MIKLLTALGALSAAWALSIILRIIQADLDHDTIDNTNEYR